MNDRQPDNNKLVRRLIIIVVLMFGFGFALVPLYDVFCEVTGINGKTGGKVEAPVAGRVDQSRTVTVEFVTYISGGMPWEFRPVIERIQVHPGERRQVAFYARNRARQDIVGQAIPSVAPGLGAKYFHKIECFCFNRQPLAAGEETEMGLVFYIDPEIPDNIQTLTLSYTLYNLSGNSEAES
ncbi:cytochrome c oxidase assembly protein [Gallaecimonas sp. GXIMD4217]|uniref:cytochrome c oxidase assembly protein n=1 Tax=Gallaecimonas sp. GXIMD4217 TaxID=3131927 RepID=UPI00311B082B